MDVNLTIDVLSVEGLGPRDPDRLQAAVARQLGALLAADGGRWAASRTLAEVVVDLEWDGRGGDDGLAAALARGIHRAVGR